MLLEYGCLEHGIDRDAKRIIGKILLKYILRMITTCSIEFDNTAQGLFTYLSTARYPFVIFYLDENRITHDKEILEHMSYDEYVILLKELVRDFNQVTNYRIINCEFPHDMLKNISMGQVTKSPSELALKMEILLQHYQRKKLPMKRIQEVASRYSIELNDLQKRKVVS